MWCSFAILTYQEIKNKKDYFLKRKQEIENTLAEVSRLGERIDKFREKILSDPKYEVLGRTIG